MIQKSAKLLEDKRASARDDAWLTKMGGSSLKKAADDRWGRILLMGVPKGGKTVACALTAPPPVLILNCDRPGAAAGALELAAEYGRDPEKDVFVVDVRSAADWTNKAARACYAASEGKVRTVVVDTITFLVDMLVREIVNNWEGNDKRQAWGEVGAVAGAGFEKLFDLDAHLIVNAHAAPDDSGLPGVLPAVQGQMKRWVPGTLHDWICLDVSLEKVEGENGKKRTERNEVRSFLIGPQKYWLHGARHAKRTEAIDADVTLLLERLGVKP